MQAMSGIVHLLRYDFDRALIKEASENYRLSIRISPDGFSFCIFDNPRNKFAAVADWDFQGVFNNISLKNLLKEFIPQQEWLQLKYEKILIIVENQYATIIPKALYLKNQRREYLKLNFNIIENDIVKCDVIGLIEAVNIFSIPNSLFSTIVDNFPEATIHHHSSALIQTLLLMNKNKSSETEVFVNIRKGNFDIVIIKNNTLLFYNSFPYNCKEDFIYYLIFVLEQLKQNPEETQVTLIGNISKISNVYEIAYKYVRRIGFGNRNNSFDYSYIFDEFPPHFYFNLLHSTHCEL